MTSVPVPAAAWNVAPSNERMARNVLLLGAGQVTTTALAIVLTGAIGRSLGPSDFGLWYLLTAFAAFASVFVDWGYGPYVIREVARHPNRIGELTGTLLGLRGITALLLCAPAILAGRILGYDQRTRALMVLMTAASIPVFLASSYSWIYRGRERMDVDALLSVVLKVLTLVLTLTLLALGGRLVAIILASAIAGAIAVTLAMGLYRHLGLPPLRATFRTAHELIGGAAPFFAGGVAVQLQRYVDVHILSMLVPAHVLGWYGAAAMFTGTLIAPASILNGVMYPRLSRTFEDESERNRIVHDTLRPLLLVAGLGAVGTYLFADVVVRLVYTQAQFGPAAAVVRAFAPTLFLMSVDMSLAAIACACGAAARFARAKLLAVCLTSALDVVFIRVCQARWGNGGIGVMLSFAVGELVMIATILRLIPRGTLDRRTAANVGRTVLACAVTLLLAGPLRFGGRFASVPACMLVYAVCSTVFGLVTFADLKDVIALFIRRTGVLSEAPNV